MEEPTITNNILRLSADMENLRGLGQQAAMVCNTEDGRFKYLVCPVQHPLQSWTCLPCTAPVIEFLLYLPCTIPAIKLLLSAL